MINPRPWLVPLTSESVTALGTSAPGDCVVVVVVPLEDVGCATTAEVDVVATVVGGAIGVVAGEVEAVGAAPFDAVL